jgi:hypothetical protein
MYIGVSSFRKISGNLALYIYSPIWRSSKRICFAKVSIAPAPIRYLKHITHGSSIRVLDIGIDPYFILAIKILNRRESEVPIIIGISKF